MLLRVVNPQQGKIDFGYDALGRRVWKEVKHKRTCWLWDGNVPLHEWTETKDEPRLDFITWVFEDGSFVPTARITDKGSQSIVTDYLGTPTQMFDANGEKTWEANLDIYGRVRTFAGRSLNECPFRFQGQYHDSETGLYYNRFRYYDPNIGSYISQDPIRLSGGNPTLYGYVHDINSWIDVFGLMEQVDYTSYDLALKSQEYRLTKNRRGTTQNVATVRYESGEMGTIDTHSTHNWRNKSGAGRHAERQAVMDVGCKGKIVEIYSELEPCPNCQRFLVETCPDAKITYSFPLTDEGKENKANAINSLFEGH